MEQQSTPTRDRSAIALRNAIRTGLGRTDEQLNRIGVPSAPEDQKRARTLIRLSLGLAQQSIQYAWLIDQEQHDIELAQQTREIEERTRALDLREQYLRDSEQQLHSRINRKSASEFMDDNTSL